MWKLLGIGLVGWGYFLAGQSWLRIIVVELIGREVPSDLVGGIFASAAILALLCFEPRSLRWEERIVKGILWVLVGVPFAAVVVGAVSYLAISHRIPADKGAEHWIYVGSLLVGLEFIPALIGLSFFFPRSTAPLMPRSTADEGKDDQADDSATSDTDSEKP